MVSLVLVACTGVDVRMNALSLSGVVCAVVSVGDFENTVDDIGIESIVDVSFKTMESKKLIPLCPEFLVWPLDN